VPAKSIVQLLIVSTGSTYIFPGPNSTFSVTDCISVQAFSFQQQSMLLSYQQQPLQDRQQLWQEIHPWV